MTSSWFFYKVGPWTLFSLTAFLNIILVSCTAERIDLLAANSRDKICSSGKISSHLKRDMIQGREVCICNVLVRDVGLCSWTTLWYEPITGKQQREYNEQQWQQGITVLEIRDRNRGRWVSPLFPVAFMEALLSVFPQIITILYLAFIANL